MLYFEEETVLFNKFLRRIFILAFIATVLISVNVAADLKIGIRRAFSQLSRPNLPREYNASVIRSWSD